LIEEILTMRPRRPECIRDALGGTLVVPLQAFPTITRNKT
jgi:hypothetical protein